MLYWKLDVLAGKFWEMTTSRGLDYWFRFVFIKYYNANTPGSGGSSVWLCPLLGVFFDVFIGRGV